MESTLLFAGLDSGSGLDFQEEGAGAVQTSLASFPGHQEELRSLSRVWSYLGLMDVPFSTCRSRQSLRLRLCGQNVLG